MPPRDLASRCAPRGRRSLRSGPVERMAGLQARIPRAMVLLASGVRASQEGR